MSEFNSDELDAPSWLNEEFFGDVLRKSENNDSIKILEVKITPGTGKGDHYASVMFRAVVAYDTVGSKGSKSLIIKTMPEFDGHKKELLGESYIFETEISMYSNTIPKFEAELRKIGDNTVLGARCIYHCLEPRKCIIFEDLVPKGYETLRDRLVNMEEAKAALLKLAKWHAVSYKLAAERDPLVIDYKESFLNMKDVEEMPIMKSGMNNFIDLLENIYELKPYIPKLRSVQKTLFKRVIASSKSYREEAGHGIFVLCHGDFHAKNMMFKRSASGEFEDVMLLDFQVCYFAPAAMDILYALYMLLSEDLRRNHRDELIYYYFSNFIETLEKLKFEGEYPKVGDFYIELIRHRHWELFLATTTLPLWYALYNGTLDPDEMMTSDQARRNIYNNPAYIEEVKRLLPIFLHQGYLE